MLISIFYAVLGVLCYESVRAYRCIVSSNIFIPDIGLGKEKSFLVYAAVMLIFVITAGALSSFWFPSEAVEAFLFGAAIPTGSRLLTSPQLANDNQVGVDDLISEAQQTRSLTRAVIIWLTRYNV